MEAMKASVAASLRRRSWGHQGRRGLLELGRRGREEGGRVLFRTVWVLIRTERSQVVQLSSMSSSGAEVVGLGGCLGGGGGGVVDMVMIAGGWLGWVLEMVTPR